MHRKLRLTTLVAGTALAFAAPMLLPAQAEACGGTFCDTGPTAMPVDQSGENVLFHIGDNSVEAHIQITIDPDTTAEQFAWVIPVVALPEFEVGSQILFDNMLNASVPRYGMQFNNDFCGDGGDDLGNGDEGGLGSDGGETGDTGADTGDPGGPDVVFEGSVGAFDIAVLDGGTVEGVMQWLADNGYQQDPASEPILAQYLEEGFLFVALKFGVESGVEDVHPIVIRYDGVEPCLPIRLTRIAAQDDMDIRVFFVDDARVVPTNYRHVLVNPLKIDWFNNATNYKEVITMAVDADGADGNAFVTEYAGPSNIVPMAGVYNEFWDPIQYANLGATPLGIYDVLVSDNLMFCDIDWDFTCTALHPLLQPILDTYLPVPDGIDPVEFYTNMAAYEGLIDLNVWDALALAQTLDERIFKPGLTASQLFAANPYLTRMYTTISPNEMNADPMFRSNATLPEVPFLRQATQSLHCDGSTTVELPDGREVYFPVGEPLTWPDFQDQMPFEEDVDQENNSQDAPLISLVDNTALIDQLLAEYNESKGAGGEDGGDEAGDGDAGIDGEGGSCSCTAGEDSPLGAIGFGLALLGFAGFVRRKR